MYGEVTNSRIIQSAPRSIHCYVFFFLWRIFLRRLFLLCFAIFVRFFFLPHGICITPYLFVLKLFRTLTINLINRLVKRILNNALGTCAFKRRYKALNILFIYNSVNIKPVFICQCRYCRPLHRGQKR